MVVVWLMPDVDVAFTVTVLVVLLLDPDVEEALPPHPTTPEPNTIAAKRLTKPRDERNALRRLKEINSTAGIRAV